MIPSMEMVTAMRSIPEPITGSQIIPAMTNFVYSAAGKQDDWSFAWADLAMPGIPVSKYTNRIAETQGEMLVRRNTARAARGTIRAVTRAYKSRDITLKRYTLAGVADKQELENADPWNVALNSANLARLGVKLDSAMRKQAILLNTGSYQNVLTITAGEGFNQPAGFHLRDVFNAAAHSITAATGIPKKLLHLGLLGQLAVEAVLNDTELLTKRILTFGAQVPDYTAVAKFLGISEANIWDAQPIYRVSELDPTPTQMFPLGNIIIYYPGEDNVLPEGDFAWLRTFKLGGDGGALPPFYENKESTWYYPWEMHELPYLFNTNCAQMVVSPYQTS